MKVALHQPDMLPYSGFWYKMAKADLFELRIYDQYLEKGYQRRVKMRDRWGGVPIPKVPTETPIIDVRIDGSTAASGLSKVIHGRYSGSPFYKTRGNEIQDRLRLIHTDHLWQFNLGLMLMVREMLEITTPVSIGAPPIGPKSEGIVSLLKRTGATTYLSGTGARDYMGDCQEFTEAGIEVAWSEHKPVTGDSILTVLMDCENPMSVVLAEESTPHE